jgi:hypothetical protein
MIGAVFQICQETPVGPHAEMGTTLGLRRGGNLSLCESVCIRSSPDSFRWRSDLLLDGWPAHVAWRAALS